MPHYFMSISSLFDFLFSLKKLERNIWYTNWQLLIFNDLIKIIKETLVLYFDAQFVLFHTALATKFNETYIYHSSLPCDSHKVETWVMMINWEGRMQSHEIIYYLQ